MNYTLKLSKYSNIAEAMKSIPADVTSLDLSDNKLGEKTLAELIQIINIIPASVITLDLSDNKFDKKTADEFIQMIKVLPEGLTSLYLANNDLGYITADELVKMMKALPEDLAFLYLGNNKLGIKTTDELVHIIAAIPRGLASLNLKSNRFIGKETAADELVLMMKALPVGLESIDLSFNSLHSRTLPELVEMLKAFPDSLTSMDLNYNCNGYMQKILIEALVTNYRILELTSHPNMFLANPVDHPIIKEFLHRNQLLHEACNIEMVGLGDLQDVNLLSKRIAQMEAILPALKEEDADMNDSAYPKEHYRLFCALRSIQDLSVPQTPADAIARQEEIAQVSDNVIDLLSLPFTNSKLQVLANLAYSQYLSSSGSIKEQLKSKSYTEKRIHYQQILHGFAGYLQDEDFSKFACMAFLWLRKKEGDKEIITPQEFATFEQNTVLLQEKNLLSLIKKAIAACKESVSNEKTLLTALAEKYNHPLAPQFFDQSPQLTAVLKQQFPGKISFGVLFSNSEKQVQTIILKLSKEDLPPVSEKLVDLCSKLLTETGGLKQNTSQRFFQEKTGSQTGSEPFSSFQP